MRGDGSGFFRSLLDAHLGQGVGDASHDLGQVRVPVLEALDCGEHATANRVLFATFFTIFVVPVAYAVVARRTKLPGSVEQQLEGYELADAEARVSGS